VENRCAEPVEVVQVSGSCNCMKIEPQAFTVAPGATKDITVTIDFTKKPSKDGRAAFGLTYMVKDEQKQMRVGGQWVLGGKSKKLIIQHGELNFGILTKKFNDLPSAICTIQAPLNSENVTIECFDDNFEVAIRQINYAKYAYNIVAKMKIIPNTGQRFPQIMLQLTIDGVRHKFPIQLLGMVKNDVEIKHQSLENYTKASTYGLIEIKLSSYSNNEFLVNVLCSSINVDFIFQDNENSYHVFVSLIQLVKTANT
jgi:hypothetical protein